jgi:hypothetical protein
MEGAHYFNPFDCQAPPENYYKYEYQGCIGVNAVALLNSKYFPQITFRQQ